MTTTDIGAARSNEFVVGWQLAEQDKNPYPVNRQQGGTLDNDQFGDVGKPSENDPVLPSRQPIPTPNLPPRRRK
jgi:hypothetical protein